MRIPHDVFTHGPAGSKVLLASSRVDHEEADLEAAGIVVNEDGEIEGVNAHGILGGDPVEETEDDDDDLTDEEKAAADARASLVEQAEDLGITGITDGWKTETIEKKIAEALAAAESGTGGDAGGDAPKD